MKLDTSCRRNPDQSDHGRVQVDGNARSEAANFPGVVQRGQRFVKVRKNTGAQFGELEECTEDPFRQSSKNWPLLQSQVLDFAGFCV
ncbi:MULTISPECIES: hypothetical protein [Herbaspirillum]|uniref:hypothetical protein n=1 Tax=Herbaspirillum TaxID=963 RepID=UPI001065C9E6|nr:hypothetical protein [Herbaspirillum sp. 1130]MBP1316544.1 hypothetical protein [Herbaspirillum sp. 1130]